MIIDKVDVNLNHDFVCALVALADRIGLKLDPEQSDAENLRRAKSLLDAQQWKPR